MPPKHVEVTTRAEKDLRGLDRPTRRRIAERMSEALTADPPPANADVKPLKGAEPWLRLRIGDYRVLYRPLTAEELTPLVKGLARKDRPAEGYLVDRIVHRQGLVRAVSTLD